MSRRLSFVSEQILWLVGFQPGKTLKEVLMKRADQALYQAREKGRDCVVLAE